MLGLCSWKPDQTSQKFVLVMHAGSGSLTESALTLDNVADPISLVSSEGKREFRITNLSKVVTNWDKSFKESEPNAVLSSLTDGGKEMEIPIILGKPVRRNGKLIFPIKSLGKVKAMEVKGCVLFIDDLFCVICGHQN